MKADAKLAGFASHNGTDRLDRVIQMANACGNLLDKLTSSLGQPNTSRVTLKQEDAQIVLQSLHSGTDT